MTKIYPPRKNVNMFRKISSLALVVIAIGLVGCGNSKGTLDPNESTVSYLCKKGSVEAICLLQTDGSAWKYFLFKQQSPRDREMEDAYSILSNENNQVVLMCGSHDFEICTYSPESSEFRKLTENSKNDVPHGINVKGEILYTCQVENSQIQNGYDLCVINFDGSGQKRLIEGRGYTSYAINDESLIAYPCGGDQNQDAQFTALCVIQVDGSNEQVIYKGESVSFVNMNNIGEIVHACGDRICLTNMNSNETMELELSLLDGAPNRRDLRFIDINENGEVLLSFIGIENYFLPSFSADTAIRYRTLSTEFRPGDIPVLNDAGQIVYPCSETDFSDQEIKTCIFDTNSGEVTQIGIPGTYQDRGASRVPFFTVSVSH